MKHLLPVIFTLALPAAAAAQEWDVTRRSYTFLDNRLVVAVNAESPGVLQVIRGERGRLEVAARTAGSGFAGFGLGGHATRQLSLTAVGADLVHYMVVVPENVAVRVDLPAGGYAAVPSRSRVATYRWGNATARLAPEDQIPMLPPTTAGGLYIVHSSTWAPAVVDVPDLRSVRSLSVRFQEGDFRVAASRPLSLSPGDPSSLQIRLTGEPLDLVVYVPRRASFLLRSGDRRIVQSSGGRPRALCGGVVIQSPTENQDWLTFHPREGRLDCR